MKTNKRTSIILQKNKTTGILPKRRKNYTINRIFDSTKCWPLEKFKEAIDYKNKESFNTELPLKEGKISGKDNLQLNKQ